MPNWNEVLKEINRESQSGPIDKIRRDYLKKLSSHTKRNTIAYYSGWLYRDPNTPGLSIDDQDKNAFMTTVHGMDRTEGLDLILHTPGGNVAATESLVHYLRTMFGTDIRAIIPQISMSAGTMIACACKEIIMGKQSNLGPIDPQFGGVPAHGVISEFEEAIEQIKKDPAALPLWQTIIGKYHPTFLGECRRAIAWSSDIVNVWLQTGMFKGQRNSAKKAASIVDKLSDHDATRTHSRHISIDDCESMGLKIQRMEDDDTLQDLILTVHHAYMHTFSQTPAIKIVENDRSVGVIMLGGQPLR